MEWSNYNGVYIDDVIDIIKDVFKEYKPYIFLHPNGCLIEKTYFIFITRCLVVELNDYCDKFEHIFFYDLSESKNYIDIDDNKYQLFLEGKLSTYVIFKDILFGEEYCYAEIHSVDGNFNKNSIKTLIYDVKKTCFLLDKNKMNENLELKKELISKVMNPERMQRICDKYNIEFIDYVDLI